MRNAGGILVPEGDEVQEVKRDGFEVKGRVRARLFDEDMNLKQDQERPNIITTVGRQFYVKRALAIATIPGVLSGAKLGSGTTAEAVTGAGAHIVTYITASQKAIDGGYPTEGISGLGSRATIQITWGPGVATATINECILTNEASLTDAAGSSTNTIARAVLTVVNKLAGDTLVVTWTHDIGVT